MAWIPQCASCRRLRLLIFPSLCLLAVLAVIKHQGTKTVKCPDETSCNDLKEMVLEFVPQDQLEELQKIVKTIGRDSDNTVITTVTSKGHLKMLQNWVQSMEKLAGIPKSSILVLCTDDDSHHWTTSQGIRSIKMVTKKVNNDAKLQDLSQSLWFRRTLYLAAMMMLEGDESLKIIQSDNDAVWAGDARKLHSDDKYSIVFSRGSGFPPDVFEEWNFTLCMGWVSWRNDLLTRNVLRETLLKMKDEFVSGEERWIDDQRSVNRVVNHLDHRVVDDEDEDSKVIEIKSSDNIFRKILVLSNSKVDRKCDHLDGSDVTFVYHCYTGRDLAMTEKLLRSLNLWVLE